jgi:tricorn protease
MRSRFSFFLPAALACASWAGDAPYVFRSPALSATQIVFSFAGDLWSVPRAGGEAIRLTTGAGIEIGPVFSPDGAQIAFTGEYDGNTDVFVMPAGGGVPRRLTYHPGVDWAVAWSPDGKRILFGSSRASANDGTKFFTMPAAGGFPDEVPLPIAAEGAYSPDGSHLAYVPLIQWQPAWKHYRGGQTRRIWIADLEDSAVIEIPRENSNDFNPMWVGDKIYFLSDRNGPVTLFRYDTRTREVKQLIGNHGFDFKSASAGPGAIVYEQFGSLGLYDLKSGQAKKVEIRLAGDFPEVRPHFVNVSGAGGLRNPDLSPNGARAVFEARGEIITVPAEKGDARNLTNTPAANEREPVWSPDGKTIAYFSDESGEYELHLREQDGMGQVTRMKLGEKPAFYMSPCWSPDSRKIAYLDNHLHIWYIDVEKKQPVLVDTDYDPNGSDLEPDWSPDSKWLAYAKMLPNHLSAIHLYSLADGKSAQVTDGMSEAKSPVFDKDGKYLYFTASTDSGPSLEIDTASYSRRWTRSIYLIVLAKDQASPFAPESDDEKVDKKQEKKDDKKGEEDKTTPDVKIDFEHIGQRILAFMPARRYAGLAVGKAGFLYAVEKGDNAPDTVRRFELSKRKEDVAIGGVKNFALSFSGEKMLYQSVDDGWYIANATGDRNEKRLKTDDLQVRVDPPAEWREMYHEAWRIERDFFYDPGYHGLDLAATEKRYAPFLEHLASRADLNYLFEEAMGQMIVGHLFVGGGDTPDVKRVGGGLLGADYKIENGQYRVTRVYDGENWNPWMQAPLTQPGVNVVAGEYLLAVNGRELRASDDIYSFFEATAGKAVVLRVGPDAGGAKARDVTVVPIADEHGLRHLAWIEDNRRKVDQMTQGRVAYIHMPDTATGGYTSFNRYFFAQVDKEGAIIDERFNHGGHFATDIMEYLARQPLMVMTARDGADIVNPFGIYGPKVMIINEFAGSGGDAMPWFFHRLGLGKLVGKRTWGGLVGLSDTPSLMDGGVVTAPAAGFWNTNGTYDVENRGVSPDIEVELDPKAVRAGRDPQLETAVRVVLEEMEKHPESKRKRPEFPRYERKN